MENGDDFMKELNMKPLEKKRFLVNGESAAAKVKASESRS